jgi:putative acetyltransferase
LLDQGIAFFVVRVDGAPAGCGGVQLYGTAYGDLKRLYVRPAVRGFGLGRLLITKVATYARAHGVGLLRLETGIHQHAAIGLYERMGFCRIPPFGSYQADPLSLFFEKPLP